MSETTSLDDALLALGLVNQSENAYAVTEVSDWTRSGAETYLYRFNIRTSFNRTSEYVLKACVAYSPGGALEDILDSWISRRGLLSAIGLSTPRMFGRGKGIVLEEYIPHTLSSRLDEKGRILPILLHGLAEYAGVLSGLGFSPVSPFKDLRSRGSDVVVVDFGADLGESNAVEAGGTAIFRALHEFLAGHNIEAAADLEFSFQMAMNRALNKRDILEG